MMRTSLLAILTLLLAYLASKFAGRDIEIDDPLTKELGYQRIQGYHDRGLDLYLGVRYGSAERFQLPRSPQVNDTLYLANQRGPSCWQFEGGLEPGQTPTPFPPGSEDCLLLNIAVPVGTTLTSLLPVVFYIHGGGFHNGGVHAGSLNSGEGTVNFEQVRKYPKFIFVEIQYRLGPHGFLAAEEVKRGGTLNAGLYDQQFALQWVQEHISKFGGDPSHVTLWGHSAGGGSVLQHLVANNGDTAKALGLKQPLFRAVTGGSVFEQLLPNPTDPTSASAIAYGDLVKAGGCSGHSDTLQCLAGIDETTFAAAADEVALSRFPNSFVWTPTIDGSLITDVPAKLLSRGKINTDHIFALHDLNEGAFIFVPTYFLETGKDSDLDGFLRAWWPGMTDEMVRQAKAEYPATSFPSQHNTYRRARSIWTDGIFACPSYRLAQAGKGNGYKATWSVFPALHTLDSVLFFDQLINFPSDVIYDYVGSIYGWLVHGDLNKNPLTSTGPLWDSIGNGRETVLDVKNHPKNTYDFTESMEGSIVVVSGGTDAMGSIVESLSLPSNMTTVDSQPMYDNARCRFWEDLYLA